DQALPHRFAEHLEGVVQVVRELSLDPRERRDLVPLLTVDRRIVEAHGGLKSGEARRAIKEPGGEVRKQDSVPDETTNPAKDLAGRAGAAQAVRMDDFGVHEGSTACEEAEIASREEHAPRGLELEVELARVDGGRGEDALSFVGRAHPQPDTTCQLQV